MSKIKSFIQATKTSCTEGMSREHWLFLNWDLGLFSKSSNKKIKV
jgi:hypothetical protein